VTNGATAADATRAGAYAGLLSRGLALWVDTVVVAVIFAGVTAVGRSFADMLGVSDVSLDEATGAGFLLVGSLAVAFCYYTAGFAFFGRTVGKLIFGLRVVRPDGRNPGLVRSGVRTAGYAVSSILFLGFLWGAVDRRHQAWHDRFAGTFVVYAWDARPAASLMPRTDRPLPPVDSPTAPRN
jgi:uncharacterized RDD family membrane protein YckC